MRLFPNLALLKPAHGLGKPFFVQRRVALSVLLSLFLAFIGLGAATAARLDPLEIATQRGVVVLEVEMARTEQQRVTGLMFRKELPERQGMLFDFESDQVVEMWMKNTYIPLDMLFIRANGVIARIEAMTTPFSERVISSGEPVRAVLEIPGGAAKRLGIAVGDQMSTALLKLKK